MSRTSIIILVIVGVLLGTLLAAYVVIDAVSLSRFKGALANVKTEKGLWEDMVPPPIPDERNAALIYEKAVFAFRPGPTLPKKVEKAYNAGEWNEEIEKAVRLHVAANEKTLALIREAVRLSECRFDVYEWSTTPFDIQLSHLSKLRELTRLLRAEALLHARDGRSRDAVETCETALRMGHALDVEPFLISYLVRCAVHAIAFDTLQKVFDSRDVDAQAVLGLAAFLKRSEEDAPRQFKHAMRGERAAQLATFQATFRDLSVIASLGGSGGGASWMKWAAPFTRPMLRMDAAASIRHMSNLMTAIDLPRHKALAEARALDTSVTKTVPRYCFLTLMLVPAVGRSMESLATDEARFRLARAALALKLTKAKEGQYPASLESLPSAIMPKPLTDPFTGKPLIYKRKGEGFIIYSVGPNGKDDGGTPRGTRRRKGDDVVWQSTK